MTLRRMTLMEARYPNTPEFAEIRTILTAAVVEQMLTLVWEAWDHLRRDVLEGVDLSASDDQLERSLTAQLEMAIQDRLTRAEPYRVQHESYEMETSQGGRARPLQYDIAFVLRAHPRVQWPIEAKVLPTDGQVGAYVDDIKTAFVTCAYAPFTGEGAMVGYLRKGLVENAFRAIAVRLELGSLDAHAAFPQRPHKVTSHVRIVPEGKRYARTFRCHHLLMDLSAASGRASPDAPPTTRAPPVARGMRPPGGRR